jgi:hypothetical protein
MTPSGEQRARGRWLKGQSGNPAGRPAGRSNRIHAYLRQLLETDAEQVVRAVVKCAIAGDMGAAKLVLDRVLPKRVCRPIDGVVVPVISNAADACAAMSSITNATLQGVVTTTEAAELATVVETYRRTVETVELLARLEHLERLASDKR